MNEYMKETNEALLHTYNQFPVVLERGEGAYLYDTEGKKYLDFAAGYAVSSLGYADKELNDALKEQIDKIFHTSNLYYNTACGKGSRRSETYYRDGPYLLHQQWRGSGRRNFKSSKKICIQKRNRTV